MSLHSQFNITEKRLSRYSPLDQLSEKYLSQTIKNSKIMVFEAGETVFEKEHFLEFSYYLIEGKISVKTGLLSSTKIDSHDEICLHPINKHIPNGVSVKAVTSGVMVLIDPAFLDRALAWSESEAREVETLKSKSNTPKASTSSSGDADAKFDEEYFTWMTSLLEFPLFFNLPPSNMTDLFEKFQRVKVAQGDVVIKEGTEGDYFYLLLKGSANVLLGDADHKIATLKPGAYFGEEALVSDTVRSASVVMNEDGELARLDKASFQSMLHDPLVQYMTPKEYKALEAQGQEQTALLDIRSLAEFEHIPMPDCKHIPLDELRERVNELDKATKYFLSEEGGQRNEIAAHILSQNGFKVMVIRGR